MELLDQIQGRPLAFVSIILILVAGGLLINDLSNTSIISPESPSSDVSTDTGETSNLTEIHLGYVPAPLNSPHYTAKEEGFYRDHGLKVVFHEMSGPEIGKAVANGDLEVGSSATTPAVYQAKAGLPVKLVAARAGYKPEQEAAFMMVRDGVNISSIEDFKGKTICTETAGSMDELFFYSWADRNDIDIQEDIEYTYTSEQSWESAFASGSVDACVLSEPGRTYLERKELAHVYEDVGGWKSAYRTAFVAFREDYLENNPEIAKEFLMAYAEAAEYARNNPDKRMEYVSEYTKIPEDVLREAATPTVPAIEDMEVNATLINYVQDDMARYGLIDEKAEIEPMVDNSIINEVQQELMG